MVASNRCSVIIRVMTSLHKLYIQYIYINISIEESNCLYSWASLLPILCVHILVFNSQKFWGVGWREIPGPVPLRMKPWLVSVQPHSQTSPPNFPTQSQTSPPTLKLPFPLSNFPAHSQTSLPTLKLPFPLSNFPTHSQTSPPTLELPFPLSNFPSHSQTSLPTLKLPRPLSNFPSRSQTSPPTLKLPAHSQTSHTLSNFPSHSQTSLPYSQTSPPTLKLPSQLSCPLSNFPSLIYMYVMQ